MWRACLRRFSVAAARRCLDTCRHEAELRPPGPGHPGRHGTSGDGGGSVKKRVWIGVLLAAVGALALVAAGCGGGGDNEAGGTTGGGGGGNVKALPASSCGPLEY